MRDDRERKAMALAGMAENFGKEISPDLMRMWLKLLEPYAANAVELATLRVICEYDYKTLPPFAILRKELDAICNRMDPGQELEMMAEAEWGGLLEAIRKSGRYGRPVFCETTAYVVRNLGGWSAICHWSENQLQWQRKAFIEAWKNAHGNVPAMRLGAAGVTALARDGRQALNAPSRAGELLPGIVSELARMDIHGAAR